MADEIKTERVSITIRGKKGRRRAPVVQTKGPRYGPFTRPVDDDVISTANPQIILLNAGVAIDYRVGSEGIQLMCYAESASNVNVFTPDLTFAGPLGVFGDFPPERLDLDHPEDIALWATRLQANLFTTFSFASVPHNSTMPVPFNDADALDIAVRVGGSSFPLAGGKWQVRPDVVGDELSESSLPANTASCFGVGSPNWYPYQREIWRDYGILRPKKAGALAVETTGVYVEPFDVTDTTNYKVVKLLNEDTSPGTFESPEVVPEQLKKDVCRLYVVPQLWKFAVTYIRHLCRITLTQFRSGEERCNRYFRYYTTDSPITDTGYAPAFSAAQPRTSWAAGGPVYPGYSDGPARLVSSNSGPWNPADTSETNLLSLFTWVSVYHAKIEALNPQIGTSTPPATIDNGLACSAAYNPEADGEFADHVDPHSTQEVGRANSTVVVTQNGAPVGLLVGAIEFAPSDEHRYLIFRKTERVIDPVTIYSGGYDDPGYKNTAVPVVPGFAGEGTAANRCTSASESFTDDVPFWMTTYPAPRWTWETLGAFPCSSFPSEWNLEFPIRIL